MYQFPFMAVHAAISGIYTQLKLRWQTHGWDIQAPQSTLPDLHINASFEGLMLPSAMGRSAT